MSSTDLDAPPLKLIMIAILVVLGLHVFTAVALVAMKPSAPKTLLPKQKPPIEIELVSLPAALPKETVKVAKKPIEKEAAKVAVEKTPPLPKPPPAATSKAIAEQPKKPVLQKEKAEVIAPATIEKPLPISEEQITQEKQPQKPIQQEEPHPAIDKAILEQQAKNQQAEQRRIIAVQAEKAAQEAANQAQAKALQEDIQKANAKAARDAQAEAQSKSDAKAKAGAEKAAAASNTPMNFNASSANWRARPNFSFPDRGARGANSGDTFNLVLLLRVNKQGGIDSVSLAQSSGNAILDREAQRQVRSGKFRPFTNDAGAPVVGNVTLPVSYAVP